MHWEATEKNKSSVFLCVCGCVQSNITFSLTFFKRQILKQKTTTYQNKHNISLFLSFSFTSSHTLLQIKEQLYSFEKYLNIMSKNWMLILIWPILQKYPFTLNIYLKNWTRFNKSLFSSKENCSPNFSFYCISDHKDWTWKTIQHRDKVKLKLKKIDRCMWCGFKRMGKLKWK